MKRRRRRSTNLTMPIMLVVIAIFAVIANPRRQQEPQSPGEVAATALLSLTPAATRQSTSSPARTPTNTPPQTARLWVTNASGANVRSCSSTACAVMTSFRRGQAVSVLGIEDGEEIGGNTRWYAVDVDGETGFIHSSLLENAPPPTFAPTVAPLQINPPAAPASNNTRRPRNCTEAVAWGLSAVEAAQWDHLDRDNDGVACYGD